MKDRVIKSLFGEDITINDSYMQATLKITVNVKKYVSISGRECKIYELNVHVKDIRRIYVNHSFRTNILKMYSRLTKSDMIDLKNLLYTYLNGHIAPLINTYFYKHSSTRFRDGSEIKLNNIKCIRV